MKIFMFEVIALALCWQSCVAEISGNGYFYDKPRGTLFDESPSQLQREAAKPFPPGTVPPSIAFVQNPALMAEAIHREGIDIVPAQLVYHKTKQINVGVQQPIQSAYRGTNTQTVAVSTAGNGQIYNNGYRGGQQTQTVAVSTAGNGQIYNNGYRGGQQTVNVFKQTQPTYNTVQAVQTVQQVPPVAVYTTSGNVEPVAFHTVEDNSQYHSNVQQPCGAEPIIAQINPNIVASSGGQAISKQITSCGPNNDCSTINVQSDRTQKLTPLPIVSTTYNVVQGCNTYQVNDAQPRTADVVTIVRPPSRRQFEYTEEIVDNGQP